MLPQHVCQRAGEYLGNLCSLAVPGTCWHRDGQQTARKGAVKGAAHGLLWVFHVKADKAVTELCRSRRHLTGKWTHGLGGRSQQWQRNFRDCCCGIPELSGTLCNSG